MPEKPSWIGAKAFGDDAGDLVTVRYASHDEAMRFMRDVLAGDQGVGLIEGPQGSGKSTTVRRMADRLPGEVAVALIDGTRIKPREFLSRVLAQYGYDTGLESVDGLLKMVNMFAVQQTRATEPPVLIVDNADQMYPGALRMINTLAALSTGPRYVLRIILTGGETLGSIVAHETMTAVAGRSAGSLLLKPMSLREGLLYLHARLNAAGVNNADTVFPVDVCDRLYQQSGGWPGLMNRYAVEAIGRAATFPVRESDTWPQADTSEVPAVEETAARIPVLDAAEAVDTAPPALIVTRDGALVDTFEIRDKKILIGRSDFADLVVDDEFASKIHLALLLYSDALVLLDLNSANGTTVNSVRVRSTVLKSDDIISLGHHRLKVQNAPAIGPEIERLLQSPDTVKMKHLVDIRRQRARRAQLAAIKGDKRG
ncbi:MAG: FHA domain-containing protein [Woeseiaceae bacterium]|nr:FHA domain-containing protein [Woeseiaceae bacterium]